MKKIVLLVTILHFILAINAIAQTTGQLENFDDGSISKWTADQSTYKLSVENQSLKIEYNRDGSSAAAWYNFNYKNASIIDITKNPIIIIRVKSTVNTALAIKPTSTEDVPLITNSILGDGVWRTVRFNVSAAGSKKFDKIYMYFDGGTTTKKSGTIWFDEIRMGDSTLGAFPADWTTLDRAITSAQNLLLYSTEGSGEGNFPAGSKATLQAVINSMIAIRAQGSKDQKVVDQAEWDLSDACVKFETSATTNPTNLVDKITTKETKYLYLNMLQLQQRSLLFGMHDATGYGVGWSGDDSRSDVKDVCGDFPALFSEDINKVELENEVERLRNRLLAAYNGGSVITMPWHQYDPDGVGFYFADAKGIRIVANILPGGSRHAEYKAKLNKVARFFKALRGSKGESIPVIFRPYHEHSGNAFWWGPGLTTTNEYNQLWQFTQMYLRDSLNVHNLIYALSPMLYDVDAGEKYFNVYPGDNYVDIFGSDYYFSTSSTINSNQMMNGLRTIVTQAKKRNKISALTEVGQENLPTSDWFTKYLLNPIKADTLAKNIIYAAVWRNESTSHHYAPFPGDATVPDFMNFYNDPFTVFQKDLPNMYIFPAEDKSAPKFVSKHDATLISITKLATISVETDERAFLRYSIVDESYDKMKNQFSTGEGSFKHSVQIEGTQGEVKTIYVQAQDVFGNKTATSLIVKYKVDTLQTPIAWTDKRYPTTTWKKGLAVLGTDASAATKVNSVQTIYVKNNFNYNTADSSLLITVNYKGGVAVYLNNTEIGRFNLPTGTTLEYSTAPTSTAVATNSITISKKVNAFLLALLQKDANSISFEVHGSPTELAHSFKAQMITQFRSLIPFASEWFYFDNGSKPLDVKLGDITAIAYNGNEIPVNFNLYQNYPNPFNPTTRIKYDLASQSHVSVQVFDVLGQKVSELINENQQPGVYDVKFDGSNLSSGVYLIVFQAGDFVKTQKIILLK